MKESKTREELKKIFIEALKEPQGIWKRGWQILRHERNTSGIEYKGINQLYLSLITRTKHYSDNRWFTYNQARKLSTEETPVYVKKGEKGYPIEKWFTRINRHDMDKHEYEQLLEKANAVINRPVKNKKGNYNNTFEFHEMERIVRQTDIEKEHFDISNTTYIVFNASQIEGIRPIERKQLDFDKVAVAKEVIENYIDSQGIILYHTAESRAYYRPADDTIVMPLADTFHDEEEYLSTLAHECCHSTGHKSRLDRDIQNKFGDEDYSIEELRAELSSVFLCNELDIRISDEHIENHKTYIQSWVKALEDKSSDKVINGVFKDVYTIVDYIKEKGNYDEVLSKHEEAIENTIIKRNEGEKMEDLLEYFALKYDGNFKDMYEALADKEQINHELKDELFSKVKDFKCTTLISEDYPEIFKILNAPPMCLFYKGDIGMIDKHYDSMSVETLDNNSRTYTVIDIKSGKFFIAYESYEKAVELDKSMDMKRERVREMAKEYNELLGEKISKIELINSKSVLDCESDIDVKRHIKELSDTLDRLKPYEQELCIASAEFVDKAHAGEVIADTEMTLKELFDEKLKYYDISTGTDFKIDKTNDVLILSCYGMHYEMEGEEHIKQIDIKIKLNNENKSFKRILDKEVVSKAIDKVHNLKR